MEFSTPAIYDRASKHYFVAVQAKNGDSTLLTWSEACKTGTLTQSATRIPLSVSAASVLPTSSEARASRFAVLDVSSSEMNIDDNANSTPSAFVAHKNGAISLCSISSVISESLEAVGQPILAASVSSGGTLFTVHSARRGFISIGQFTVHDGKLRCECLQQAGSPSEGAHPVAATCASGRAAVLWSDGTFAAYDIDRRGKDISSQAPPLSAAFVRRLRRYSLSAIEVPARTTSGRKKRANQSDLSSLASGNAVLVSLSGGIVAVAGLAPGPSGGGLALKIVAIDVIYGSIQCARGFTASDVGISRFDAGAHLQVNIANQHRIIIFCVHVYEARALRSPSTATEAFAFLRMEDV